MRTVNPQKVENRKIQILDAAKQCFELKGFHATTMAEICTRACISPGALYRYFSSKEEIISAMCSEQQFRSMALLTNAKKMSKTPHAFQIAIKDLLSDIIESYCNREHGAMAAELIAESMRNEAFAQGAASSYLSYQKEFAELLKIGQELGEIDASLDIKEAAGMMMAMVDGLVLRIAFLDDLDKVQTTNWLVNLTSRYLCPSRHKIDENYSNFEKTKNINNQIPVNNLGDYR